MMVLQEALKKLSVSQASSRHFRVLEEDQPLKRLSQLRIGPGEKIALPEWVLVCCSGRWVGYLTDQILKDISSI